MSDEIDATRRRNLVGFTPNSSAITCSWLAAAFHPSTADGATPLHAGACRSDDASPRVIDEDSVRSALKLREAEISTATSSIRITWMVPV
jgi:hypothetical protein